MIACITGRHRLPPPARFGRTHFRARPASGRGGEGGACDERPQLDELVSRNADRAEGRARPCELDVTAHPDRLPQARMIFRAPSRSDERGRDASHWSPHTLRFTSTTSSYATATRRKRVRDGERLVWSARLEVPDDAHRVPAALDTERPRRTGWSVVWFPRVKATPRSATDGSTAIRLSSEGCRVAEVEVDRERHLEPLAHAERAVLLDVDRDIR